MANFFLMFHVCFERLHILQLWVHIFYIAIKQVFKKCVVQISITPLSFVAASINHGEQYIREFPLWLWILLFLLVCLSVWVEARLNGNLQLTFTAYSKSTTASS